MGLFRSSLNEVIDGSGMSRVEVARLAGFSPQYLNHLLSGSKRAGVQSLAALLGVFPEQGIQRNLIQAMIGDTLSAVLAHTQENKAAKSATTLLQSLIDGPIEQNLPQPMAVATLPRDVPLSFVKALNQLIEAGHRDRSIFPMIEQLLIAGLMLQEHQAPTRQRKQKSPAKP